MEGQTYAYLTVLEREGNNSNGSVLYRVRCVCGKELVTTGSMLRSGGRTSCGCMRRTAKTHGMSRTSTYRLWNGMVQRCNNPNHPLYKHYGGRGIAVCKRWLRFENFYADMGDRPAGLELDRIDNDKGYSKSNCRWTTHSENLRNRRSWKKK